MNKGIILTFCTVFFTVIFQFIFIRYASYQIDKEVYGNFVLLQTLIAGLSTILLQIPSQAFDRFYNESNNKTNFINQFRTYLILINLLSLFIIYIYSLFIDKFSFEILFLIFVLFFLLNTYGLNQKIYLLNLERKKYMYLKILEASSKFLTPIIFYFYFNSLESLILGMVIGYLFSSFILYIFMRDLPFKIHFNSDNFRKYFIYAYPFFFMSIFTWGLSFSDRYFI
jgi:O-antigen/teichoic acid export membrane protein